MDYRVYDRIQDISSTNTNKSIQKGYGTQALQAVRGRKIDET